MANISIDELARITEDLDSKFQEMSVYLESCVTESELQQSSSQIFGKLSRDVNKKITEIYNTVSEEYRDKLASDSINCTLGDNVYTKAEIDAKGFLTEHQSLDNYVTVDYMNDMYVKKYDVHNLIKCNCLNESDVKEILKSYVTLSGLSVTLDGYYTKSEIDDMISEALGDVSNLEGYATRAYVSNVQGNVISYVNSNFLTKDAASKLYLSLEKHDEFADFVDFTYLKKSDFDALGIIDIETIKNYPTKDDLNNYALSSTVDELSETVRSLNSTSNKLQLRLNTLSSDLSSNYLNKNEIAKNFYTKDYIDDSFLSKKVAEKNYLSIKTANKDYLTKTEARYTYLAIEDYKSLRSLLTINSAYRDDPKEFQKLLDTGKLIDGIYIVGDTYYIVKDGEAFSGSEGGLPDVYTKTEIDDFDFASKTWVIENCKGHNWEFSTEY